MYVNLIILFYLVYKLSITFQHKNIIKGVDWNIKAWFVRLAAYQWIVNAIFGLLTDK